MEISGSQGLQNAQAGLTQATVDVARPTQAPQGQTLEAESSRPVEQADKTEALVSAIESSQQGQAAAEVVEAGSEAIGSIINIEA